MNIRTTFLAAALAATALGTWAQSPPAAASNTPVGIDPANLDRAVPPCENFFQFATGGWQKLNPIPPSHSRWGSFDALIQRNQESLKVLCDAAKADASARAGSNEKLIGDFFAAATGEPAAEALGAKPLEAELASIAALKDLNALAAEVARLQIMGVQVPFRVGSMQDAKDSTKMVATVRQGGLGLPDRDYYLKQDAKSAALRETYLQHVARVFRLLGDKAEESEANAKTAMALETKLAEPSMLRAQMRDPKATYNPMAVAKLAEAAPVFLWSAYFSQVGLPGLENVVVGQPDFFKGLGEQLKAAPLSDWKTYLRWHLARQASPFLSKAFVDEDFAFQKTLTGALELLPRWQRAVIATDGSVGDALGQLYVAKYFSPESKARVKSMVANVRAVLKDDLATLAWMSPPTRVQALAKLDKITEKIGYPEKWKTYEGLAFDRKAYLDNAWKANAYEFRREIAKVGKPVDRTEWHMTPPTVNAYYSSGRNEIVFPAGILQPPFFDPKADDAVNYGGIGTVISHEITHGFDDSGAQYDGDGNLKNWWADADLKAFQARGECIVDQFGSYTVDDLHLNGKLVEGESIADLGGVTLSLAAWRKSLEGKPAPPEIGGFTSEQRFFLGFATLWASNIRPEMARLLVSTDPHPPAQYRVNGPLGNMPAFARAFGCKAAEPMVRPEEKRCQIW